MNSTWTSLARQGVPDALRPLIFLMATTRPSALDLEDPEAPMDDETAEVRP